MRIKRRVNLKLSWSFGLQLFLATLVVIAVMLLIEAVARSAPVQARVPFQAYGSNHVQFDFQINHLKSFVTRHGAPDCFILGSSMPLRGINPVVLGKVYKERTGKELVCYNFSVVGVTISAASVLAEMLVDKYQSRLLIVGTNFLDYSEAREEADDSRFSGNTWTRYELGHFNIDGWLVEHSYAYRIVKLISYGAYGGLDFSEVKKDINKWRLSLTDTGYGMSEEIGDVNEPLVEGKKKTFLREFGAFNLSARNIASLEKLVEFTKQKHIQLVFVQMPYHPTLVQPLDDNGQLMPETKQLNRYISQVDAWFESMAKEHSIPYFVLNDLSMFSDKAWHDRYHLNITGSRIFSRWLANQLAQAVENGQLQDPISGK